MICSKQCYLIGLCLYVNIYCIVFANGKYLKIVCSIYKKKILAKFYDYRYSSSSSFTTDKITAAKNNNSNKNFTLVGWILWHINLCRLFNTKSFYTNNQFYFKQFSLAWVHSLIVKSISISNYISMQFSSI